MFMLGPKASGKTRIAQEMCDKTNMTHIDFSKFVATNGLQGQDEEDVCVALLDTLAK